MRKILISDLLAVVRGLAIKEIQQRLRYQQTTIPQTILNQMSEDIRAFLLKIAGNNHHLPQSSEVIIDDEKLTYGAYLASFL